MVEMSKVRRTVQNENLELLIVTDIIAEITLYREERGYSQRKLSELSGVPQKTISRIESGKDIPKFRTLLKLLNALDLDLEVVVKSKK